MLPPQISISPKKASPSRIRRGPVSQAMAAMRMAAHVPMNTCQGKMRSGWRSWRKAGEYVYAIWSVQFEWAYGSAISGAQ